MGIRFNKEEMISMPGTDYFIPKSHDSHHLTNGIHDSNLCCRPHENKKKHVFEKCGKSTSMVTFLLDKAFLVFNASLCDCSKRILFSEMTTFDLKSV